MSPADLPWWGWLLVALGLWALGVFLANQAEEKLDVPAPWIVIPFGLGGGLAAIIGVVRFVKWTSVITSKPANGDQVKTGQRERPGQSCFTPPNPLAAS